MFLKPRLRSLLEHAVIWVSQTDPYGAENEYVHHCMLHWDATADLSIRYRCFRETPPSASLHASCT